MIVVERITLGRHGAQSYEPASMTDATTMGRYICNQHHDRRDDLVVRMTEGFNLLTLRGGGSEVATGTTITTPGAGVAEWLDDSDYEEKEMAVWSRQRIERDISSDHRESAPTAPSNSYDTAPRRTPVIFGQNAGTAIVVCLDCNQDTILDKIRSTRACCGRRICDTCYALNCTLCDGRSPGQPRVLHLASALGLHGDTDPTTPTIHDLNADESTRQWAPNLFDVRDMAWHDGTLAAEVPRINLADGSLTCSASPPGMFCLRCGVRHDQGYNQWRICKCSAVYCVQCAEEPCVDCPVNYIWQGPMGGGERGEAGVTATALDGNAYDSTPLVITPGQAAARRKDMMEARRRDREQRKQVHRQLRSRQERDGLRPRRERPHGGGIVFATANVTLDSTWKEEDSHGNTLRGINYLAVQEHGQRETDKLEAIERWIRASGGDPIIDPAYVKNSDPGGGTALVARSPGGIRKLSPSEKANLDKETVGRYSMGIGNAGHDFLFISGYGITGGEPAKQYKLWGQMAAAAIRLGLPFVWAADWQVPPAALEASGLPRLLDASICAPNEATNAVSGTIIDYFLVSNSMLVRDWHVQVEHECIFSPHRLVALKINLKGARAPCRRLSRPRPYPPRITSWSTSSRSEHCMGLV